MKSWYGHFVFFGLILGILGEASAIALTPNSIQSQLITQTSQVNVQRTGSAFNLAQIDRFAEKGDCYFAEDLIRVYNERGGYWFDLSENQRIYLHGDNNIFENTILVEVDMRTGYEYGYIYKDEPLRPCDQQRQNSTRDRIRSGGLNTPRPSSSFGSSGCRLGLWGDRNSNFLEVYDDPSDNSPTNGSVEINDPVTIDEDFVAYRAGNQEWVKIRRPIEGWLINRFPRSRVDNLEGCNILRR
ncbi:hypothetical protein [Spirulina sp. 06S082]|uniref:hypothetical protein n=1 Tax=Spirulina sp. 06S082 TaxID=3110248 RepID=UPI002B21EEBA|nr:hypothetical protein [Spirulina sp. 06S082]